MDQSSKQPSLPQKNPIGKWIALMIIIVIVGGFIAFIISRSSDSDDQPPQITTQKIPTPLTPAQDQGTPPVTEKIPVAIPPTQKSIYKDGTYSAIGNYIAPSGAETIGVSVTVKNDVVTDVRVQVQAKNPTSKNWQNYFAQGVGAAVVGVKIDAVNIDTVSGSSLTPVGFMDAISKIKTQAKV